MHEAAVAYIDGHVRGTPSVLIEKQEVALAQIIRRHQPGGFALGVGAARYLYTGTGITVIDQPAAIEALRANPTATVATALRVSTAAVWSITVIPAPAYRYRAAPRANARLPGRYRPIICARAISSFSIRTENVPRMSLSTWAMATSCMLRPPANAYVSTACSMTTGRNTSSMPDALLERNPLV